MFPTLNVVFLFLLKKFRKGKGSVRNFKNVGTKPPMELNLPPIGLGSGKKEKYPRNFNFKD